MKPKVLFVAGRDGGACRIPAAYLNHLAGDRYLGVPVAPGPGGPVGPELAAALRDDGVDLPDTPAVRLTPKLARAAARIVRVGADDADDLPAVKVTVETWGIPEPDGRPPVEVRVICDTARRLVDRLVARLDTEAVVR